MLQTWLLSMRVKVYILKHAKGIQKNVLGSSKRFRKPLKPEKPDYKTKHMYYALVDKLITSNPMTNTVCI